jgi:hypothetical protein
MASAWANASRALVLLLHKDMGTFFRDGNECGLIAEMHFAEPKGPA